MCARRQLSHQRGQRAGRQRPGSRAAGERQEDIVVRSLV